MQSISELTSYFPYPGNLAWIGTRPSRKAPMVALDSVAVSTAGLEGDHYNSGGKRTITLIQAEHLDVIASLAGANKVAPQMLRRNLMVGGINLLAIRNRKFQIGEVTLRGTGICAPCSRMEKTIGPGGYNAVRGHGGITAEVLDPGNIKLGDKINVI